MYDIDYMLNGQSSREHYDELLKEAEAERLAQVALQAKKRKQGKSNKVQGNLIASLVTRLVK